MVWFSLLTSGPVRVVVVWLLTLHMSEDMLLLVKVGLYPGSLLSVLHWQQILLICLYTGTQQTADISLGSFVTTDGLLLVFNEVKTIGNQLENLGGCTTPYEQLKRHRMCPQFQNRSSRNDANYRCLNQNLSFFLVNTKKTLVCMKKKRCSQNSA